MPISWNLDPGCVTCILLIEFCGVVFGIAFGKVVVFARLCVWVCLACCPNG